jgi:hypothetical protein
MGARAAIIGAGVAGLTAARSLQQAGVEVVVFEKSRGLGGRMATRRAGELQFDHGVQYVSAKGPAFTEELERWRACGAVAEWFAGAFVGAPRMTAPARLLGEGLTVVHGALVERVEPRGSQWLVHAGDAGEQTFDAVALATPAPQAAPILASAGVTFEALERVQFAPCWALMVAFDAAAYDGPDWMAPEGDVLAWLARDSAKPGRDAGRLTFTAHANAAWSRQHLEDAPDVVAPQLLAATQRLTGVRAEPSYLSAHRWRFALVEHPAGEPFLFDRDRRIGACGDWCLGARVESAFESGRAMGAAVAAALGAL